MPTIFNFIRKEGKYFAPIVSEVPTNFRIATPADPADQTVPGDDPNDTNRYIAQGTTEKGGTKGTFMKITFTHTGGEEAELYAVNCRAFQSSN